MLRVVAATSTTSSTQRSAMARGVLATSTLILLGRIEDAEWLPTEPLITTITLAESLIPTADPAVEVTRAGRNRATGQRPRSAVHGRWVASQLLAGRAPRRPDHAS